jgi:hypothetical protein
VSEVVGPDHKGRQQGVNEELTERGRGGCRLVRQRQQAGSDLTCCQRVPGVAPLQIHSSLPAFHPNRQSWFR